MIQCSRLAGGSIPTSALPVQHTTAARLQTTARPAPLPRTPLLRPARASPTRPLPSPLARPAGFLAAFSLLVTPLAQGSYRYAGALAVWVFSAMILCQYMPDGMTQDSILLYLVRMISGDLARRRGGRALGVRGV